MKTPLEKQYPHLTAHARARIGLILTAAKSLEWAINSTTPTGKRKKLAIKTIRRVVKIASRAIAGERKGVK
ncbi:MAG TPA: hypothetical protein V6D33_05565 [Cyanophyceae cyanobacterium]